MPVPDTIDHITLATCYSRPEAVSLMALLRSHDIPVYGNADAIGATCPHLLMAFGGIALRVPVEHAGSACQLLESLAETPAVTRPWIGGRYWVEVVVAVTMTLLSGVAPPSRIAATLHYTVTRSPAAP